MLNIKGPSFELFFYGCHLRTGNTEQKQSDDQFRRLGCESCLSLDKYGLDKWLISFLREGLHLSNGKPTGGFLPLKAAL